MEATASRHRAPTLRPYLADLAETPLLDAEEERRLAHLVADGDREARDHLVRANLRLVVRLARDYIGRGLPLDDLVAEGNLGLIRAAEGFDIGHGVRFSTYAAFWVRQSIRSALDRQARPVRLPNHAGRLLTRWHRASTELADRLGREPAECEVANALGLSGARRRVARDALGAVRAMGRSGPGSGDGDANAIDPSDDRQRPAGERLEAAEELARLLDRLDRLGRRDPRLASVVRLRHGLGDQGGPRTLREVGERLGLTRQRVMQLEREALRHLVDDD